jgi:two-component system sensor histidine kinase TctE
MNTHARGSILRRLVIQLLAGSAVLGLVLYFVVQGFARQVADESQDSILAASVTSILDAASVDGDTLALDLPYSAFSMLGNAYDDRVFYAIHANSEFLSGYNDLPLATVTHPDAPKFRTLSYRGESIRVITSMRRVALRGETVQLTATLGQSRSWQRLTLMRISRYAAALAVGFFVTAAAFAVFAARSAIAPLERLAGSVARRGAQDLRPVVGPVPSEMVPLVDALNRFIDRLRMSLSRSEDFIAEAAHRVRTPLATVRAQAEITLRRVDKEENRQSLRRMLRAIDESSRAAGQLLDHAMVTFRSDQLEQEPINLSQMARDMINRFAPLADLRDIALAVNAPDPIWINGDQILIQNALRNLLDNAIKYSPVDAQILLETSITNNHAQISVTDQGSGFPRKDITRLTGRFVRGSNVDGVVGSGLGLTIVDEVMRAHAGQLAITNNIKGPGACVTLLFSLA